MQYAMKLGEQKRQLRIVQSTQRSLAAHSTMELVEKLANSAAAPETKAHMVQLHIDAVMNDELELLAEHALQMQVGMDEPAVYGPACRGDARNAVEAALSIMRRRMSKMLRDHQRDSVEE